MMNLPVSTSGRCLGVEAALTPAMAFPNSSVLLLFSRLRLDISLSPKARRQLDKMGNCQLVYNYVIYMYYISKYQKLIVNEKCYQVEGD